MRRRFAATQLLFLEPEGPAGVPHVKITKPVYAIMCDPEAGPCTKPCMASNWKELVGCLL